ncbi:MAG: hypothetical protein RQ952_06970 [Thermoproteota archaeon]|jgi:hypothetical protein|nr:hypothetical protein [Thermoproteota archaeon]
MTESEILKKSQLMLEASFLINIIPIIYEVKLNRKNLLNLLFLLYGLDHKKAKVLIDTSKGIYHRSSEKVIKIAQKELMKFLNTTGKIVILEVFLEQEIYEFREP